MLQGMESVLSKFCGVGHSPYAEDSAFFMKIIEH